ncbi:hypothetical protein BDZ89DRAFT_53126 [Hymenopellis radicata]|nr:hypothetical protein BDZ89DRAFT_53126 [Hymenopellis radicata]
MNQTTARSDAYYYRYAMENCRQDQPKPSLLPMPWHAVCHAAIPCLAPISVLLAPNLMKTARRRTTRNIHSNVDTSRITPEPQNEQEAMSQQHQREEVPPGAQPNLERRNGQPSISKAPPSKGAALVHSESSMGYPRFCPERIVSLLSLSYYDKGMEGGCICGSE